MRGDDSVGFKGLYTNPNMIITNCEAKTSEEVIRVLAGVAHKEACVDPTFVENILEREHSYPTGLPTVIPIAIPHVHEGCTRSFFAMAVLKEPVKFGNMGDPDSTVDTKLVFMFGITEPSEQTKVLRKFSTMFQDEKFLNSCIECLDNNQLLELMKDMLGEYIVV